MRKQLIVLLSATALSVAGAAGALANDDTRSDRSGPATGSATDTMRTGQAGAGQVGGTTGTATGTLPNDSSAQVGQWRPLGSERNGIAFQGMAAEDIIGSDVVNPAGDKIASVDDLLVDGGNQVKAAVLSVGGVLGIGDRKIAVPVERFQASQGDDGDLVLNATEEELKNMAEYRRVDDRAPAAVPPANGTGTGTAPPATTR